MIIYSLLSLCFYFGSAITIPGTVLLNTGDNATLPCQNSKRQRPSQVYWQFTGVTSQAEQRVTVHDDLDLQFVVPKDSGNYTCHNDADDSVVVSYTILVPGPPSGPSNLSVTEVDGAIVLRWMNTYSQDYLAAAPDTTLKLRYRSLHYSPQQYHHRRHHQSTPAQPTNATTRWHQLSHSLPAGQTLVAIQHLEDVSSYEFELWAENARGRSAPATAATSLLRHAAQPLSRIGPWERSQVWLVCVVAVLAGSNLVAGVVWLLYYHNSAYSVKRRRRHRAIANHSGLSAECEQLELVCHAQEPPSDASLTLPHHAALV